MERYEFTFPSADGVTAIHAVEWVPEGPVRAVLVVSHGVAEYILRYRGLAEYLTERGFAVAGHDHLGHGTSVAEGRPRLYFGKKGSWNDVVADLYERRQLAGRRFPGVPVFLLGHSMGSFLARTYLIRYPGTVQGAILMGTGQMSPALVAAGRAIAAREIRKVGEDHSSPVVMQLAFGAGDPTVGLFREMLSGIAFISKQANLKKMNLNTPVLFISGAEDPVGDCSKGVERAAASFRRAGVRDVTVKLYPQLRHEILQEAEAPQVCEDLYQWLCGKLPEA